VWGGGQIMGRKNRIAAKRRKKRKKESMLTKGTKERSWGKRMAAGE
jgi:hypothetical protein